MLMTLTVGLLSAALVQQTDTVISVRPGSRLDVHNFRGQVTVTTWERNEMRIVADHSSRSSVDVSSTGSTVRLRGRGRHGAPATIDYELTVPSSMDVEVSGTFVSADLKGIGGEVHVGTVHGNVFVRGGRRAVQIESVQGNIRVEGASGRIEAASTNGGVEITNCTGDIRAETVNGQIDMSGIRSGDVDAVTLNGTIRYDGAIDDGGRYTFRNHNGNITLTIPTRTNATVSVSTFNGEFESLFPVTLTETRSGGRSFSFVLGDGGARVTLESFGGRITLRRRGN